MKARTIFTCSGCGYQSPRWLGRCTECEAWSSFVEEVEPATTGSRAGPRASAPPARAPAMPLPEVDPADVAHGTTGMSELDRCLGGGLVAGSLVLLGGEPGIGKSTLLLQAGDAMARGGRRVLYVSGEESPAQVRLRAERVRAESERLFVLGETDLDTIFGEIARIAPDVVVVDSVQVVHDAQLSSAPGTVSQVKQAADRFLHLAKERGTAVFLIGHVTKEGTLAGPRTLEHVVDVVLSFESESGHVHRIVRTLKNRFGPTGEVGVFEMRADGLAEVPDASRLFLAERRAGVPGSAVFPSMEGTRPVLVEVQALVAGSPYSQSRRMTLGIDSNRLTMLLAVIERRGDQSVAGNDVFVNAAGGLRLREAAADLAIVMAVVSAARNEALPEDLAAFGEVGLGGEVRSVDHAAPRLREVRALGFERCLVARGNAGGETPKGLQVLPIDDLAGALRVFHGSWRR